VTRKAIKQPSKSTLSVPNQSTLNSENKENEGPSLRQSSRVHFEDRVSIIGYSSGSSSNVLNGILSKAAQEDFNAPKEEIEKYYRAVLKMPSLHRFQVNFISSQSEESEDDDAEEIHEDQQIRIQSPIPPLIKPTFISPPYEQVDQYPDSPLTGAREVPVAGRRNTLENATGYFKFNWINERGKTGNLVISANQISFFSKEKVAFVWQATVGPAEQVQSGFTLWVSQSKSGKDVMVPVLVTSKQVTDVIGNDLEAKNGEPQPTSDQELTSGTNSDLTEEDSAQEDSDHSLFEEKPQIPVIVLTELNDEEEESTKISSVTPLSSFECYFPPINPLRIEEQNTDDSFKQGNTSNEIVDEELDENNGGQVEFGAFDFFKNFDYSNFGKPINEETTDHSEHSETNKEEEKMNGFDFYNTFNYSNLHTTQEKDMSL